MRKIWILLLLLLPTVVAMAQKNGSISGYAFDSVAKQPIPSATVTILDKKDSSLVSFTMTDHRGWFELKGIPTADYRLMISHVNYHNCNKYFSIDENNRNLDLGNIIMHDVSKVLQEVVVRNEAPPVTLVGDTVQYNAGSFKTAPNATVEQLLKKLPGVNVDKDGTVTAQGEKVNRVLVDGKEFFSNDPKMATRNLNADAVDKVQVYDRQSDQAQLTGFDDGNYEKTINLKLKKDKKKGLFGKITASGGDRARYEGRFNVNSFKGARQMSAIGMANNTNAEGFSFMDILNFTGAMNQMRKSGGNVTINLSAKDASVLGLNNNNNGGINTSWGGGFNYNNIIGTKLDLQSSYSYNRYNPVVNSHTLRQNIFQGSSNFYEENAHSDNLNKGQRLNLTLMYQLDSMHSIKFTPSFNYQDTRDQSLKDYNTKSGSGSLINEGITDNSSNNEGYNFKNEILFRKKFDRKGRTFSILFNTSINESTGDGSLSSVLNYYNAGSMTRSDTMNQRNNSASDLKGYNARVVYTEPLWKTTLLEFSAGKSRTKSSSEILTYDYNKANGKYDQLNDLQSNDFENLFAFANAGIRMRKQARNYNYSLGLNWQEAELEGKILTGAKDSVINQRFRNLLPNAGFRYNFTRFKNLSINYSAGTNQPTLSQLQPVPDVSNPLYIREGNPELKQEYSHNINGHLHLLSPYRNKNLFFFFTIQATNNKIVNYDEVDQSTGVRKTKPINVDGVYMLNGNINYSMPVQFLKANMQLGSGITYNNGKQFINGFQNTIKTLTFRPTLRFNMNPTEKFNLELGTVYNIYNTRYTLDSLDNNYLSQEYNISAGWQLPGNFYFSSEFTYTFNSRRASGFNTDVPIWNASFSKQFLKFNRGEIKISATDLLNRNTGISRNTNQNYIEDKEVNTLKRFFLLSFTYSLSKSGLNSGQGQGGIRLIAR